MTTKVATKSDSQSKAIRSWQAYPEKFIHEVLKWKPWDKQVEILHSLRDNKETYVKSCNGAGKSYLAAAIVIWWMFTRRGKVVTTAPTWRQVREILWANIGAMCERNYGRLGIKPLQTKMQLAADWFAVGLSTKVADKFQGYHGNVLVVVDEASGVEDPNIWAAIDGNLTDDKHDRLLAIGNPLDPDSVFAKKFKIPKEKGVINHITISAFDTPNVIHNDSVIKGMVTRGWVNQKLKEWGENSPLYQARVLGEFPKVGDAALFPMHWMQRAFEYNADGHMEPNPITGEDEWIGGMPDLIGDLGSSIGLDVSGSGTDNNAMTYMTGHKLQAIAGWPTVDSSDILGNDGEVREQPTFFGWIDNFMPNVGIIDALGLGDPIYRYAQKYRKAHKEKYRDVKIRAFKATNPAAHDKKFGNYKAESYWNLRNLLQVNGIDLGNTPPEMQDTLITQANAIRWRINPSGLIYIEDKEKMKAREGFSPDELESLIMAIAGVNKPKSDKPMSVGFEYNVDSDQDDGHPDVAAFEYNLDYYMR